MKIRPRYLILIILFVLLLLYAAYQARSLILGPQVWIESPQEGYITDDSVLILEGRSKNVAWIQLNGRQIFTDEEGNWREKLILSPGLSIMTVEARDRFGRDTEKTLQIILNNGSINSL